MKRGAGIAVLLLCPMILGWGQSCTGPVGEPPMLCGGSPVYPRGWQRGAQVTVYISNAFSPNQVQAIVAAYQNWSNRLGSNVTINPVIVNTMPPDPVPPYSEWQLAYDGDCPGKQACTHAGWCPYGYTQATVTNVQPGFFDPGYQLFAHEVGHTYGIEDCDSCLSAVTVMEPIWSEQSAMTPRCCDAKAMWRISNYEYGQPALYCSPRLVQGTGPSPGTAYLSPYPGNQSSVMATFPQNPQSGDTIVAGCLQIHYASAPPTIIDNQGNSYTQVISWYDPFLNAVPVALYAATDIASPQNPIPSFTLTCSSDHTDTINLFALEFADLGDAQHLIDYAVAEAWGGIGGSSPFPCGTLSTSSVNDLVTSIYNNASPDNPVGISPTLGAIPTCYGGQGGECVAQNGSAYEAGGMSNDTASSIGQYSPAWNYGHTSAMSCAAMSLKVIGP